MKEYHPLPTMKDTLGALGKTGVFRKLDTNGGLSAAKIGEEGI